MPIHRSRAAILLIGSSIIALCAGAAITAREGQAVERLRASALRLESIVDAADRTRAPLYGEGIPGFSHEEYERAVGLLSSDFHDDWIEILRARDAKPGSELAVSLEQLRGALVAKNQDSLAALKSGTHRLDAKRVVNWEEGPFPKVPKLMSYRHLVNLAVLAAEEHLKAGHAGAAADVLLDGMQFGADLVQYPTAIGEMIGISLLGIATKGALIDHGLYRRLPAFQLERLAVGLSEIDSRLELRGLAFEVEIATFARRIVETKEDHVLFRPSFEFSNLSSGFSSTIRVAATVEQEIEFQTELIGIENLPWAEAKARLEAVAAREDELGHSLWGKVRESMEQTHRHGITSLRLTHAAIQARLNGQVEPLADPFGEELLMTETEDGLQIRSVGPDGGTDPRSYEHLLIVVPYE